jgi:hypothetical protein
MNLISVKMIFTKCGAMYNLKNIMKFNKSNSTIDLIREKLFQAGVN